MSAIPYCDRLIQGYRLIQSHPTLRGAEDSRSSYREEELNVSPERNLEDLRSRRSDQDFCARLIVLNQIITKK